jgi:DNA polymerase-3 subunit epsilon
MVRNDEALAPVEVGRLVIKVNAGTFQAETTNPLQVVRVAEGIADALRERRVSESDGSRALFRMANDYRWDPGTLQSLYRRAGERGFYSDGKDALETAFRLSAAKVPPVVQGFVEGVLEHGAQTEKASERLQKALDRLGWATTYANKADEPTRQDARERLWVLSERIASSPFALLVVPPTPGELPQVVPGKEIRSDQLGAHFAHQFRNLDRQEFVKKLREIPRVGPAHGGYYSLNNQLMAFMQMPTATLLSGRKTWEEKFNREVVEGATPIAILGISHRKVPANPDGSPVTEFEDDHLNAPTWDSRPMSDPEEAPYRLITTYPTVRVFDISQTRQIEGKPVVDINAVGVMSSMIKGSISQVVLDAAKQAVVKDGIKLEFIPNPERQFNFGVSSSGHIRVLDGMPSQKAFATLIHEYAHEILHQRFLDEREALAGTVVETFTRKQASGKDRLGRPGLPVSEAQAELEADLVAYFVGSRFGIDTSEAASAHLAGYGVKESELAEAFSLAIKTADRVIARMRPFLDTEKDPEGAGGPGGRPAPGAFTQGPVEMPDGFPGLPSGQARVLTKTERGYRWSDAVITKVNAALGGGYLFDVEFDSPEALDGRGSARVGADKLSFGIAPPPLTAREARDLARALADDPDTVYLDTEGTGMSPQDEVVSVAILSSDGEVLFHGYFRPTVPMNPSATEVNGITNDMASGFPLFAEQAEALAEILSRKRVVAFGAAYDKRMLEQTALVHGYASPTEACKEWVCAMEIHQVIQGRSKWSNLKQACGDFGVTLENAHTALGDIEATRRLLKAMASAELLPEEAFQGGLLRGGVYRSHGIALNAAVSSAAAKARFEYQAGGIRLKDAVWPVGGANSGAYEKAVMNLTGMALTPVVNAMYEGKAPGFRQVADMLARYAERSVAHGVNPLGRPDQESALRALRAASGSPDFTKREAAVASARDSWGFNRQHLMERLVTTEGCLLLAEALGGDPEASATARRSLEDEKALLLEALQGADAAIEGAIKEVTAATLREWTSGALPMSELIASDGHFERNDAEIGSAFIYSREQNVILVKGAMAPSESARLAAKGDSQVVKHERIREVFVGVRDARDRRPLVAVGYTPGYGEGRQATPGLVWLQERLPGRRNEGRGDLIPFLADNWRLMRRTQFDDVALIESETGLNVGFTREGQLVGIGAIPAIQQGHRRFTPFGQIPSADELRATVSAIEVHAARAQRPA